jgi:F-type H+/Na+-transporting ATPase subunit alpha
MNNHTLEAIITKQIDNIEKTDKPESIGIVISIFNGILIVEGLLDAIYGEKVKINNQQEGMIFCLCEDYVKILVIQDYINIIEGDFVYRTNKLFFVPIPKEINKLLGQVWETTDLITNYHNTNCEELSIDVEAPGIIERDFVRDPLYSGIIAIDALIPIGRGQRELIIGNFGSGKTSLALDIIINQKFNERKVYCIYVGIGQKASSITRVKEILQEHEAMKYTMIITANADHTAAAQYITPYVAMTIAEFLKNQGFDVLIVFDDLTQHAIAYREINLLMRNIPGREAYPGDIFYIHARLLERCGKFYNGGSITGIPIVYAHDISSYIPTNIISITDGQIFLDNDLFHKGQKPAINIGISVSRLGGSVQSKYMKKVCASLKISLAATEELESFLQFSTDIDIETKKIIQKGLNIKNIFKQKNCSPYPLWQQVVILFIITKNLMTHIDINICQGIFDSIQKKYIHIVHNINKDENIESTLEELEKIIYAYKPN